MSLAESNFLYREPALYDQVQGEADQGPAKLCASLIDRYGPSNARTLVDFGCGTGRDLAQLTRRFAGIGVELQSGMVDYARTVRADLDIRKGDLRSFRLGHSVDAITCLGNTLAYLHDNADLRKAFETFAAHAHTGTLLILFAPVAPIERSEARAGRVDADDLRAEVTVRYEWDLRAQINTMHRCWKLDTGAEVHDRIQRRVLFPRELELYMTTVGFELLDIFDNATDNGGQLTGPSAYIVARYSAEH